MSVQDRYLGRKDIVFYASTVISKLFPSPPVSARRARRFALAPWLAHVLYRTMLPDSAVFHALDLLRRLAGDFQCSTPITPCYSPSYAEDDDDVDADWDPSTCPELLHHRLLTATLMLVTKYWMDDAFSNKSWASASQGYFSVTDVNDMELSMLASLNFSVLDRDNGQEVESIVGRWSSDYARWKEAQFADLEREQRRLNYLRDAAVNRRSCGWQEQRGGYRPTSGVWVSA